MPLANKLILCLGILLFLESAVSTESAALTDEIPELNGRSGKDQTLREGKWQWRKYPHNEWSDYLSSVNDEIEEQFRAGENHLSVDVTDGEGVMFKIYFDTLKQIAENNQQNQYHIRRVNLVKHLLVSGFIRMNAEEKSFSVPETIQQIIEKSIIVGGVCNADPRDNLIELVGKVSTPKHFIREAYRVAGGLGECSATRAGAWCNVECSPGFFPVATNFSEQYRDSLKKIRLYTHNDPVYIPSEITSKRLKCSYGKWARDDDPYIFSCKPGCSMEALGNYGFPVGLRMKESRSRYYNSPHPNSPGVLYECTNGHEIRYDGKLVSIRHRCTAGHFYWRPQYLIEGTSEWIYLKSEDHRRFKCGAVLLWKPEPSVDDSDSSEEDSVDDSDSSEEDTPSPQTGFVSSQKMQRQTGSDLYQQQRQKIRDTADPAALPQPAPRQPVLKPHLATTVPGAPTITRISPGDRQIVVQVAPPAEDGGSTVSNYRLKIDGVEKPDLDA
eukprot:335317_1